eukprot:3937370-Rhodomonas_salina.5
MDGRLCGTSRPQVRRHGRARRKRANASFPSMEGFSKLPVAETNIVSSLSCAISSAQIRMLRHSLSAAPGAAASPPKSAHAVTTHSQV